jgi:hypothetical protein
MVPGSRVAIRLFHTPSTKPIEVSASGSSLIPKTMIRTPKNKIAAKEINPNHLITPIGPAAMVFSK